MIYLFERGLKMINQMPQIVADIFEAYPEPIKNKMMIVRSLIFQSANSLAEVGMIEEKTQWGEPAYRTKPKTGSTIRIDWKEKKSNYLCVYFNCKTTIVDTIKEIYGNTFRYEGNRCVLIEATSPLPTTALLDCFAIALTYYSKRGS